MGDEISSVENSIRDVIELLLKQEYGDNWIEMSGVTEARVDQWKLRLAEEPKRRPGGEIDSRLIYYAEYVDLITIIEKQWDKGFKDCFKDKRRFMVYMDRLSAFRNPDAHSRALMPFEEQLVLGMSGELRQEITVFLSQGGGGLEPEYFARIEEVIDSFGTRHTGLSTGGVNPDSKVVLRPGDVVSFSAKAWDPEDKELSWKVRYAQRQAESEFRGDRIKWDWKVEEGDIGEHFEIHVKISSERVYGRHSFAGENFDDLVILEYRILPTRKV